MEKGKELGTREGKLTRAISFYDEKTKNRLSKETNMMWMAEGERGG